MKTHLTALHLSGLAALLLAACTTDTAPLYADAEALVTAPDAAEAPPDAGFAPDAEAPPDAGFEPDAEVPDSGPADSGVVRTRVCPTEVALLEQSWSRPSEDVDGRLEVAAAAGWAWVSYEGTAGYASFDVWHRAPGTAPRFTPRGSTSYAREVGHPQLSAHGDDVVTESLPATDRLGQPGVFMFEISDLGTERDDVGFARNERLTDVLHTPNAHILALTSSTGPSRVMRVHHHPRSPTAWVTRDASNGVGVEGFRVSSSHWPIWWEIVMQTSTIAPGVGAITEQANDDGEVDSFEFRFICDQGAFGRTPRLHDVQAGDVDRVWYTTSCSGIMQLTAASRRQSLARLDIPVSGSVRAPSQLAYDGLTMTLLEWRSADARPRLVFFDARSGALLGTAPLDFEPPQPIERIVAMDMAAAPSADGRGTEYVAAFLIDTGGPMPGRYATSAVFDGCRLE